MHTAYDNFLKYSILDPTGNITALVESPVPVSGQPSVADAVMERHPDVEQVGFVSFEKKVIHAQSVQGSLRMAGGEFCGNAAMSTAALLLLRRNAGSTEDPTSNSLSCERKHCVRLSVSGADEPVEVRLLQDRNASFHASVHMPKPLGMINTTFSFRGKSGSLPYVRMRGISHILIEPDSAFFHLRSDRIAAGQAVREWCRLLKADGLGLMFLERSAGDHHLTPLVYIPGSGTLFWENSCASGSSAVGMILASRAGKRHSLMLHEPGGILCVESDPEGCETWLSGQVTYMAEHILSPA